MEGEEPLSPRGLTFSTSSQEARSCLFAVSMAPWLSFTACVLCGRLRAGLSLHGFNGVMQHRRSRCFTP